MLDEFLRVFHGNQVCGVREELQIVGDAIWQELERRGHPKKFVAIDAFYNDQNSIFVQTYVQLENMFNLKT